MGRLKSTQAAFTLIELLVSIAIIALLVAVGLPIYRTALLHADCAGCAAHMRTLGLAFMLYANDNDGQLPGRVVTTDKWPTLLLPYVGGDPHVYVDPGDSVAVQIPIAQLTANSPNNSSFIFNGFNDLGAHDNPSVTVGLVNLTNPPNLIILGQQIPGGSNFYMDLADGDQNRVLKKQAYFGGSNYTFADGSVQFMLLSQYSDSMWLVNKNYSY
jgi:prepilin-type N-terminal cleavage/methylation domain-containing protein/prepilin-type processing-associated H-X9-DG protein